MPVSNRPPRIRIKSEQAVPEVKTRSTHDVELQEIPKPAVVLKESNGESKIEQDLKEPETVEENHKIVEAEVVHEKEFLQEIQPQPFRGSIIAEKGVYGSKKPTPRDLPTDSQGKTTLQSVSRGGDETPQIESTLLSQKQLEIDMTKVLGDLSKRMTLKPKSDAKEAERQPDEKEKLPPASMNEILKELLKLDINVEASAIIQKDGTILASAISSRISDSLFATIGTNLSMIGEDIIGGLNAGVLTNISIRGTEGVLDLAPIDTESPAVKNMVLLIFSNPKVKGGIINMAVGIVKQQVKQYLGI